MKQNLNSYITRLTQRGHGWGLVSYKYDGTVKIFGPIHFQNIGQITKFFFLMEDEDFSALLIYIKLQNCENYHVRGWKWSFSFEAGLW